jgi:hypothetical protein
MRLTFRASSRPTLLDDVRVSHPIRHLGLIIRSEWNDDAIRRIVPQLVGAVRHDDHADFGRGRGHVSVGRLLEPSKHIGVRQQLFV